MEFFKKSYTVALRANLRLSDIDGLLVLVLVLFESLGFSLVRQSKGRWNEVKLILTDLHSKPK